MNNNDGKKKTRQGRFAGTELILLLLLPALLTAALVYTAMDDVRSRAAAESALLVNGNAAVREYSELERAVGDVRTALAELLVAQSPKTLALGLDEVWRGCGEITALQSRIAAAHPDRIELSRFIIRTGDYARRLTVSVLNEGGLSDGDREQLASLYDASGRLLRSISESIENGSIPIGPIDAATFYESGANTGSDGTLQANGDYPEIDYAGPYSERAENRSPLGASGPEITEAGAAEKARMILECVLDDAQAGENVDPTPSGTVGGALPCYTFTADLPGGEHAEIAVTRHGGMLNWFRLFKTEDTAAEETEIRDETEGTGGEVTEAMLDAAAPLLKCIGIEKARPVSAEFGAGATLVCFACCDMTGTAEAENEAEADCELLLLSDTVRIWFETDEQHTRVIGADASGCCYNHRQRTIGRPFIDEETAIKGLSPLLEVTEAGLTLLPLDDLTERLCWQFAAQYRGNRYIVYVDAKTGEEVLIRCLEGGMGKTAD